MNDTVNARPLFFGLIIGLLANYLLWGFWSGLCFPVFMTIVLVTTLWHAQINEKRIEIGHWLLAGCSLLFSCFLALRGAAGLSLANASLSVYFWFLLSHSFTSGKPLSEFGAWDYFRLPR